VLERVANLEQIYYWADKKLSACFFVYRV
jgi:hypothetical protein